MDNEGYEILEEDYKAGHLYYYMYLFKMKKSDWSLSVGLSDEHDLHILLLEGGILREIPDHYGLSILLPLLFVLEAEKERNGGVLKCYILYVGKTQTALLGATTLKTKFKKRIVTRKIHALFIIII